MPQPDPPTSRFSGGSMPQASAIDGQSHEPHFELTIAVGVLPGSRSVQGKLRAHLASSASVQGTGNHPYGGGQIDLALDPAGNIAYQSKLVNAKY